MRSFGGVFDVSAADYFVSAFYRAIVHHRRPAKNSGGHCRGTGGVTFSINFNNAFFLPQNAHAYLGLVRFTDLKRMSTTGNSGKNSDEGDAFFGVETHVPI